MRPRDSQDNSVHRAQLLLCSFLAPHFSAYGLKIFNVSFRIWIANVMEHCLDPKLSKEVFKTVEQMLRHMFFTYLDLGFLLVCESRGFWSEHVVPGVRRRPRHRPVRGRVWFNRGHGCCWQPLVENSEWLQVLVLEQSYDGNKRDL